MASAESKKTILVVDDEPEVRKLVSAMVSRFGYTFLTADSGDHAITLFKNHRNEIGLLLTDVVAPGLSGPQLADKLTEMDPGLKVIYMSGYDNTRLVQKYIVEKGHKLLTKPFTLEDLGAAVQQAFGSPRSAGSPAKP